ncbi:apolipoprotein acyltransferase [Alphaproteobacteria bacterium KMM 3653]|uniref:Apolipoprotein acyltransferase n=1 Tax=Harenicola maris TaxID=2841044 RepID=A0AAP2G7B6_9RHOB|nr:apolipoprotein acyltransferase [Harenicola maris]
MIVLIAALAGAFIGAAQARRRKGARLDMLQYGAVYAIAFALLGLIVTIAIERML